MDAAAAASLERVGGGFAGSPLPTISGVAAEAFYEPVGPGLFRPTEHTIGPWSLDDQHAGPPSALLVRAVEGTVPTGGRLSRVTVDLLRGVPVAEVLEVRAHVRRPGRSVQLVDAGLLAGGQVVARAAAWWHASTDTAAVAIPPPVAATPRPTAGPPVAPPWSQRGYLAAMDWFPVAGGFDQPNANVFRRVLNSHVVLGQFPLGRHKLDGAGMRKLRQLAIRSGNANIAEPHRVSDCVDRRLLPGKEVPARRRLRTPIALHIQRLRFRSLLL